LLTSPIQSQSGFSQINLGSISADDTRALVDACEPAPFGRGPESVLDDNYRKALKLEEPSFAWRFNPDSGNFIASLAQKLCPWERFEKGFRAEVTKLNVYSRYHFLLVSHHSHNVLLFFFLAQGGFFKAHQDTPRSDQMFGSLVFTLSTPHTGGNLVFHHRDHSFDFNTSSILGSAPSTSVAYVAFYSDVQHEVLEVTSGARITITYNLYYDSFRSPPPVLHPRIPISENHFTNSLREAYRDAAFIKECKYIGFGLEHQYPGTRRHDIYPRVVDLKGVDAYLFHALQDTMSSPTLRYLYQSEYDSWGETFDLLLSRPVEGRNTGYNEFTEMQFLIKSDKNALIVWREGRSEETLDLAGKRSYKNPHYIDDYRSRGVNVQWVTPPSMNFSGNTYFVESGNEPMQEIYYYKVCIIAEVNAVKD